ncbi:MAG: hypothetical protein R3B96_16990 [Pirellulaceae bacterium]|nr:hypothetical protein [Planctomycetales bacterium]
MPKILCISAMVVAILVLVLFLSDLLLGLAGLDFAPFNRTEGTMRLVMDGVFALGGGVLGYLSWKTFKEQV